MGMCGYFGKDEGIMTIEAGLQHFRLLNEQIRNCADETVVVENCTGQRYVADGLSGKTVIINGTPGNALGAYLNGANLIVNGNAQEATGDTMNEGSIVIHGNAGDATGYAMRGGRILVKGNTGYRAGIHMKAYKEKSPVLVIGGHAGSFLGEYQAGGLIVVLGLDGDGETFHSNFCGTGMHGGKMVIRCRRRPEHLPPQLLCEEADDGQKASIRTHVEAFCEAFGFDCDEVMDHAFYVITPDTKNPYKQMYVYN